MRHFLQSRVLDIHFLFSAFRYLASVVRHGLPRHKIAETPMSQKPRCYRNPDVPVGCALPQSFELCLDKIWTVGRHLASHVSLRCLRGAWLSFVPLQPNAANTSHFDAVHGGNLSENRCSVSHAPTNVCFRIVDNNFRSR